MKRMSVSSLFKEQRKNIYSERAARAVKWRASIASRPVIAGATYHLAIVSSPRRAMS